MITARLLTILAASSLAAIAYAQTPPAPSSQPNAAPGYNASHPQQRENHAKSLRMAEAGPGAGAHSWSNMPVESPAGQSLGSVSKVVPGLNGQRSSGYVLVSGANGVSVPVPYPTAHAMVRDGKLVLSQSRFEHAPKVTQEDLQNRSDHAWRIKADHYWMHKSHGQAK